jgi:hypothetical protein
MHTHVYFSAIHNSQVMETATNALRNVVFMHNGILLSHEEE